MKGELDVRVNYIKMAQWAMAMKHFMDKFIDHLDDAARKADVTHRKMRRLSMERDAVLSALAKGEPKRLQKLQKKKRRK